MQSRIAHNGSIYNGFDKDEKNIMKLENQVTNKEISKRLKELGVKQESYFSWHTGGKLSGPKFESQILPSKRPASFGSSDSAWEDFSAFTVAELGEIIQKNQTTKQLQFHADVAARGRFMFDADYWGVQLIYLLENNLITL